MTRDGNGRAEDNTRVDERGNDDLAHASLLVDGIRRALPLLLGLIVILVVYADTLQAPFLWDDLPLLEAPAVKQLMVPWKYLTVAFWGSAEEASAPRFYRPVVTLSLALDQAIHGSNAVGFHLTNVLLHLVNVGLLYKLARRCSALPEPAALLAAMWGLLPRLTESVAWISGRTDVLCTLFVLLGWLAYRPNSFVRSVTASVLAFFALLSKEAGVACFLAIAWVGLTSGSARAKVINLAPLGVLLLLYAALRALVLGKGEASSVVLTPTERGLTVLEAVGRYFYMVVEPWYPEAQIGAIKAPDLRFVALGLCVLGALLASGFWTWRRRSKLRFPGADTRFGVVLAVVPLLLVIHLVPLPWIAVVGDRLLYLPLAAAAVLAAPLLNERVFKQRVLTAVAGALLLSFAFMTRVRAREYANSAEFWVTALETTQPENWGPEVNLAAELFRAGLFEDALKVVRAVDKRSDPTGVQRVLNLEPTHVAALAGLGRYEEAWRVAESIGPIGQTPELQLTKARLLANQGKIVEALRLAERLESEHPQYLEARAFITQMRKLRSDAAALSADALLVPSIQRARLFTEMGQATPAAKAWLALLAEPESSAEVREEAFAYLIAIASHADMVAGAKLYTERGGERLLLAFDERDRSATDLIRLMPRIEQALQRKVRD